MLKRIWHAITGNHKWVEIPSRSFASTLRRLYGYRKADFLETYGFTEINWHCPCGAIRTRRILGNANINPAKDELAELRKMAGLK